MTHKHDRDSQGSEPAVSVTATIDARGLRCPLPLLRAKQGLSRVRSGERIMVLATDAGSVRDFHSFAKLSDTRICHFAETDGVFAYILEKP